MIKVNDTRENPPIHLKPKTVEAEKSESKTFSEFFEKTVAEERPKDKTQKADNKTVSEKKESTPENAKVERESPKDEEQNDDSDSSEQNEQNLNSFVPNFQNQMFPAENLSLPPDARLILHTVDLERIVSSMQALKTKGGAEITINLVKSIFDGLQIKISVTGGEGLVVDFLAKNEKVKKHLENNKDDLLRLLKDRGLKLKKVRAVVKTDVAETA